MKKMKRILTLILTVCLMLPCFSTVSYAADGIIFFDDLETSVGETFTIKGTVVTTNDVIGEATVQMTYDAQYIRFMEGEGVTKNGDGNLTYTGKGDGKSDRVEFSMKFQALKEGSMRMEQGTATVKNKAGKTVACESGYSAIKIGEGDPSLITTPVEGNIEINGASYGISSGFSEAAIPTGFVSADVTYQNQTYPGIKHEASGIQGLYLTNSEGTGAFFLHNTSNDTFYPCEQIIISNDTSIVVLGDISDVQLDKRKYVEATMSINGIDFPAWYMPDREGYYAIYALNSNGEKAVYLYDSKEHTYQRTESKSLTSTENQETSDTAKSKTEKVFAFISDNLLWFLVGVACVAVIGLILIIVLAIKLRNRNLELDDLYDEYGIDLDEPVESNNGKVKGNAQNPVVKQTEQDVRNKYSEYYDDDDDFEDEYEEDEYEEDEYEEDEYEDDFYEEDELEDLRRDFAEVGSKNQKKFDSYYDDDDFDDYDDDERDGLKKSVNTDTFEMDFIEFD